MERHASSPDMCAAARKHFRTPGVRRKQGCLRSTRIIMKFLDLLKEKIVVFDGAMGSSLQAQELSLEDWGGAEFENCSENLLYTKPEAIEIVHRDFLDVGCDVIETNSFGGSEVVLAEFGIAEKTYDVNRKAAEMAKRLANDYSTKNQPRFVAGSIGPGTKLPTLGHITYRDLKAAYETQVHGLIDGGSDLLVVETCQDLLQTKAALAAIFDHFEKNEIWVPVFAQVTIETFGTMLNGTEIGAALTALEPFPIDVIGMNCGTGPRQMADSLKYLCEHAEMPVSVLPNAGLPEVKDGKQHYDETPESFTEQVVHFAKDYGVNIVGGCCGTTPKHIQMLRENIERVSPKQRDGKHSPSASSIYFRQPYKQDASFLIVGERVNASGSRKMRRLLDAEDWDGLVSLAKEQEREGSHILDVNVDFVGRDGAQDMKELVSRLVTNVKIPLMLDSTEWEKMEAGLEYAGGKCILNSTNYEDGEPRFYKVLELCKEYGAAVVIGLIDEDGMARTAQDKVKIAHRAYKDATEFGIPAHDIFFDPLALPISTGIEEDRANAHQTIEAIKQIKEEVPETNIILGVSNISFGLNPAARVVLNSVFLNDAVEAGMNSAIVNAIKILPLSRFNEREIEVARELIYDKREWNADTPVRNEGEARIENKKGWHKRGYLPHFDGAVTQFVTFRLADSLPQGVLKRFEKEIDHDKLTKNSDEYREMVEQYLDKGVGSCILKNPTIAEIVQQTIEYENERTCKVASWVVMPNHVHILLRPLNGHSLSDILKRIKGVSARKINELEGSSGSVWQPDYFDRFIRDEDHFLKTIKYIKNNPVKAGLCETAEEWIFGSNRSADTPVRKPKGKEKEADKSVRVPGAVCIYDPLTEFTTLFEGKKRKSLKQDISDLPIEEKLQRHIIDGEKIGLEDSLNTALKKYEALDIINVHLLGGMKVVGDLFGSGQMQLPFVLQSAEAMKAAVKFLEPHMEKVEGETHKGTMVLATVKGDVHDIGKNLVDIILTNNGYRVVNLGIKQTIDAILDACDEHKPDAIGMSGLLVKSTLIMRDNLEIMNERAVTTPVVLGGAALNRRYVDNDLIPLFKSKLFYARDAFDGLNAMDLLTLGEQESEVQSPKSKVASDQKAETRPQGSVQSANAGNGKVGNAGGSPALSPKDEQNANVQTVADEEDLVGEDAKLGKKAARVSTRETGDTSHKTKSDIQPVENIPTAPFYGSKVVEIKDLTKVFAYINETALFKGQWQYKQGKKSKEEYQEILKGEVYPRFEEVKAKAIREKLLEAKLVYGYFPCQSEGNDLIIYEDDEKTEKLRFTFPRQPLEQRGSRNLCLADFFAPKWKADTPVRKNEEEIQADKSVRVPSGKIDVVPFHLVTMGRRASEHSAKLFKNDDYTDYLLFHGLSVESAEALAEMWHKRIREELGIAGQDAEDLNKLFRQGYQGSRYSFGYPACPNLEDQTKLFELIKPERIDVSLTDEFMLDPEQSTSAIFLHHPEARYFNVE